MTAGIRCGAVLLLSFCAAAYSQTAAAGRSPVRLADVGAAQCSTFEWLTAKGLPDKAAIAVPVKIDGTDYRYQLDTGADYTVVYGVAPSKQGWGRSGESGVRLPVLSVGGIRRVDAFALSRPEIEATERVQGSLGLESLLGTVLLIDFPHRLFCVSERGDFPSKLHDHVQWSAAEVRSGHLYVELTLSSQPLKLMFDTGSSSVGVEVDHSLWHLLTGRKGIQDAENYSELPSWGKMIRIAGAPASGELEIGEIALSAPMVSTIVESPTEFRDVHGGQGLLGCAPFLNSVVVVDLGVHPRFGLLRQ